jgi:hypothetical protein
MGDDLRYIIPAPGGDTYQPVTDVPVALARERRVQGRLFEKHILTKGLLIHPVTKAKINVDDAFVAAMQDNFAKGYCPIVQVPLANAKNEHVENPGANLGEVMGIRTRGDKVYALIDAREDADKFGKTYLGASAYLSTDYTDTKTDAKVGPTLLHVAVTNRPYVTDLDDYTEVLAASDDSTGEVVVLTAAPEDPVPLTLPELLAALKTDHGIDVEQLQAAAAAPQGPDAAALSSALVDALKTAGLVGLSDSQGDISLSDVTAAVVELAADNKGLHSKVGELELTAAQAEVDGYISVGRLLPKTREVAVRMALANDRDGLAAILAPVGEPYVKLSAQNGLPGNDGEQGQERDIDGELARLTATHGEFFTPNGTRR